MFPSSKPASSNVPSGYGLPPRPSTASSALWTHLLRFDSQNPTSLKDMPVIAPAMAPLDKNATSMRVLLHDTQANFEKFTNHVGKLLEGIQETTHEIKVTQALFERDRENLCGDIVDLVNRSQKEIQKSIGLPAQKESVGSLFKDVNHRLQEVDQRLDAIQAFNQTHSQALQTQMQAVQILLDKQGSVLTAVLPLLPLLQALPLHVKATKTSLLQELEELVSSHTASVSKELDTSTKPIPFSEKALGKRKRSREESVADFSSPSHIRRNIYSLKKHQIESPYNDSAPIDISAIKCSKSDEPPVFSRQPSAPQTSPSGLSRGSEREGDVASCTGISPTTDSAMHPFSFSPVSTSHQAIGSFATPALTTPRRPLVDLPVHMPMSASSRQTPTLDRKISTVASASPHKFPSNLPRCTTNCSVAEPCKHRHSTPIFLGITPTAARPPRMLGMHASIANSAKLGDTACLYRGDSIVDTGANLTNVLTSYYKAPDASRRVSTLGNHASISGQAARGENFPAGTLQKFISPPTSDPRDDATTKHRATSRLTSVASWPALLNLPNNTPLAMVSRKMKHKRSPVKDGKRFISLLDSEDEEEDA